MERVSFRLGEKKYVDIRVVSKNGQELVVENPRFSLKNGENEEINGECEIEKESSTSTIISALIQPQIAGGSYNLEFTYTVPPEILKHVVVVNVI